jgi:transposase
MLVMQRTQLMNALRGHFSEIGIVVPTGPRQVHGLVDGLMTDDGLPQAMQAALKPLVSALYNVTQEIAGLERAIAQAQKADETARPLAEVPGIGTLTAMVLSASITAPQHFHNGREFAAYLGLVPMQYTTGGKPRLGRIYPRWATGISAGFSWWAPSRR